MVNTKSNFVIEKHGVKKKKKRSAPGIYAKYTTSCSSCGVKEIQVSNQRPKWFMCMKVKSVPLFWLSGIIRMKRK